MQDVPLRCRLLAWALAFVSTAALSLFLSGPPAVVHAEDGCGKVIPMDALGGPGGEFVVAAGGAAPVLLTATEAATFQAIVSGGGMATAGATAVGGTVLLGLAAGLGTFGATCKFLDMTGWDGCPTSWFPNTLDYCGQSPPPTLTTDGVTISGALNCSTLGWTGAAGAATDICKRVDFGAARPSGRSWTDLRFAGYTAGNLTLPQIPYRLTWTSSASAVATTGYGPSANVIKFGDTSDANWCDMRTQTSSCVFASGGTSVYFKIACAGDVGGMCGQDPRAYVVEHNTSRTDVPAVVLDLWRGEKEYGWQRQFVTDVLCNGTTWVRAVSEVYRDGLMDQRAEVPSCAADQIPTARRTYRVPTGIDLLTPGTWTNFNSAWLVDRWKAPDSWTSGTAPDFLTCMTANVDCGTPQLDSTTNTCTWGVGGVVPASFCDPQRQANTSANPATRLHTTGTVLDAQPATGTAPTSTYTAPTPPPDGGTGPGTGTPTGTDLAEVFDVTGSDTSDGCLPGGWGRFNPISWVLQPIKCAAVWAFVPDAAALDLRLVEFEALQADPPIQWVTEGVAYVEGVSFGFDTWANAGPACLTFFDQQVCPRAWDEQSQAPGWVVALMALGLWLVVIVGVWRFF